MAFLRCVALRLRVISWDTHDGTLMTRVFFTLATASLLLMLGAMLLGLTMGDLYAQPVTDETLVWARVHRLTGLAAALSVVLVNSIVVTYFVGTSRWCKEVVETYRLDPSLVQESAAIKRRTFPWAVAGMLTVVVVTALGGAADPATLRPGTAGWTNYHLAGALGGIGFVIWGYVVCWNHIDSNHRLVQRIVGEVQRIRQERGLEVEEVT